MLRLSFFLPIVSSTIWGLSVVAAKIVGSSGFKPVEIVFARFAMASIIFIPVIAYGLKTRTNFLPKNRRTWMYIIALAITGVAVNNTIFYMGLALTTSSIASLLVSINPLMTMLFGVLLLKERMNAKKIISVLLGIIGVILIVGISENNGTFLGNLFIMIAVTIWGSSFVFSKLSSIEGLSSIAITGWSEIIGTLMLLPLMFTTYSFSVYKTIQGDVLYWFLFIGIFASVIAYIIHYKAIEIYGSGTVAPTINIIPFSGAFWSWILLQESLNWVAFLGFLLIVAGVLLVHNDTPEASSY